MKNTLLTAGGAILTIQGIELAEINEGLSLLSTIVVTVIALIRLFKNLKIMIPGKIHPISKR